MVSGLSDTARPGLSMLQEQQTATTSKMLHTGRCSLQSTQLVGMYFCIKNCFPKRKLYWIKCTQALRLAVLHESVTLAVEYTYI